MPELADMGFPKAPDINWAEIMKVTPPQLKAGSGASTVSGRSVSTPEEKPTPTYWGELLKGIGYGLQDATKILAEKQAADKATSADLLRTLINIREAGGNVSEEQFYDALRGTDRRSSDEKLTETAKTLATIPTKLDQEKQLMLAKLSAQYPMERLKIAKEYGQEAEKANKEYAGLFVSGGKAEGGLFEMITPTTRLEAFNEFNRLLKDPEFMKEIQVRGGHPKSIYYKMRPALAERFGTDISPGDKEKEVGAISEIETFLKNPELNKTFYSYHLQTPEEQRIAYTEAISDLEEKSTERQVATAVGRSPSLDALMPISIPVAEGGTMTLYYDPDTGESYEARNGVALPLTVKGNNSVRGYQKEAGRAKAALGTAFGFTSSVPTSPPTKTETFDPWIVPLDSDKEEVRRF